MPDYQLTLEDSRLVLESSLIDLLQAQVGDRIQIEYTEKDFEIVPIILKSDGGNKLTKSNTVSFRGKANSTLSSYGTKFNPVCEDGIIYLYGNDPKYKVYTDVHTAATHIDKSIIEDDNFDIELNSFVL